MSIAGSFRPGHSESEVLRNYVAEKTVEEVVVSRKAQMVMGKVATPRGASSQRQPRPPAGRRGSSARGSSRSGRARVHARLAVHPTMASAGGSARTRRAALAKAEAIAKPLDTPQPPAQAQLARVQQLMAGLDEMMATPAAAFGDVHALAAMAPPPLAALLKRGTPGSAARRQRGGLEAEPEPEPEPKPELSMGPEAQFARELLCGWIDQAVNTIVGSPEGSIFDRLLVATTASKLGKTKLLEPEPEPAPEPEPEPRLQQEDCILGNVARVATNPLEARAACRDVNLCNHPAHSWTPDKEARCGSVGQVIGVHQDEAVRLRFFDGGLQWFAREALRPVEFGSPLAPSERPVSCALIETGGLHYLSQVLEPGSCFEFSIHIDRLPVACAQAGIVCGIMAVAPNTGEHALLEQTAELSMIREKSFSLENTYVGLHQLRECESNGPSCFHEDKTVTMTCDLRTSALGLPAAMVGQQQDRGDDEDHGLQASWWINKVTDNVPEEEAEKQRKLERLKSWVGTLRFECDLLQLDGVYVNTCKVPAPPAQTAYRAFVRLPFIKEGEQAQFFVSWSRSNQ